MHEGLKIGLMTTLSATAISFAAPAMAQDGAAAEADDNRIVVTARKREENLIEVPLAVTVAGADQLARDQINNVSDLTRITPALEISQVAGGEQSGGGRLRGVGTGVFNQSVTGSVALVIDQTPVGNLNFPLLFDMAQVEVLRGPQGTLFGQGASAGVINITTRRPEFDAVSVNGSLEVADKGTFGAENGEFIANAGFNLPMGDTLALRVSSQFKHETGLQHSVTSGRDNDIRDLGLRARLRFEPSDSVSINLTGEYGRNTSDGQTFFAVALAPNSPVAFGPPGSTRGSVSTGAFLSATGCNMPVIDQRAEFYCESDPSVSELTMTGLSAVVDIDLSDALSLTSVTALRERNYDVLERNFSRILPQAAARQARTRDAADSFTQELRLNYVGNGFDLVAGGYYTKYDFIALPLGTPNGSTTTRVGFGVCTATGGAPFPPGAPCSVTFTQNITGNRTIAGFADATIELTDQFELFGGLRLDDFQNSTSLQTFGLTTGAKTSFDSEDSAVSGRIGLSYQPTPDTNFYASFSRGYKPPATGNDVAGRLFQLAAETSDAYEIGVKFGLGGMQVAANAFYSDLANFQSQRSEFAGTALVSVPFNVPSLSSKGFEVSAFGEIADGFNLNAGYQFNIIEYPTNSFADDAVDTNADNVFDNNVIPGLPFRLDGTQFLNAPKHKFTLSSDYGFPVSNSVEFFVNANLVWKSEVLLANRADPRYRYPSHALINGGFGVRDDDGGWTASIFVRNLTKEREPMAYLASTFANVADGGIRAWPIAGITTRVVGARVGFEF